MADFLTFASIVIGGLLGVCWLIIHMQNRSEEKHQKKHSENQLHHPTNTLNSPSENKSRIIRSGNQVEEHLNPPPRPRVKPGFRIVECSIPYTPVRPSDQKVTFDPTKDVCSGCDYISTFCRCSD